MRCTCSASLLVATGVLGMLFSTSTIADPSILSVFPASACVGRPVIIEGTGFSDVSTLNEVTIGGAAALVEHTVSEDILVATVPAAAVDGVVIVSVDGVPSPAAAFALSASCPPAGAIGIDLQTGEGTFPADLAVDSSLTPSVAIDLDLIGLPTIGSVSVSLIRQGTGPVDDLTSQFGLSDSIRSAVSTVTLAGGSNLLVVEVNNETTALARVTGLPSTASYLDIPVDDESMIPDPITTDLFQAHTLAVVTDDGIPDRTLSEALQSSRLRLVDMIQDSDLVPLHRDLLADTLLRTSETQETVFEIEDAINLSLPPQLTGVVALGEFVFNDQRIVAEKLPKRLIRGGANGSTVAPDPTTNAGYDEAKGAFDDSGSVIGAAGATVGAVGTPSDELDLFWPHFFMQTPAAHALLDEFVPTVPANADIAILDSGFGNADPANPVFQDIDPARISGFHVVSGRVKATTTAEERRDIVVPNGHGTSVALNAAGDGDGTTLGTSRKGKILSYRVVSKPITWVWNILKSLDHAAKVEEIRVVNLSTTFGTDPIGRWVCTRDMVRSRLDRLKAKGKILVVAAGNKNVEAGAATDKQRLPASQAGIRGDRTGFTYPGLVIVGATHVINGVRGPERRWLSSPTFASNFGPRVHLTAPGKMVIADRAGLIRTIAGTSFAAPFVTGLLAEMIRLDEAKHGAPADIVNVIQILEATADDLGTTSNDDNVANTNDDAGNGDDKYFGHGRVNGWKAMLSVMNDGIAEQLGRPDADFVSVPLISDADTTWYGFEVVTSENNATLYIDTKKLEDLKTKGPDGSTGTEDDTVPRAPAIGAYKGVRSDQRIERGVHTDNDGLSSDAPRLVVEEDPLTGIVPVGTEINERGQYVATFSIHVCEIYPCDPSGMNPDRSKPRTLSIREKVLPHGRGQPVFNLRLETDKMRTGTVAGVTFDDFVFQITPPDYGDSPLVPTLQSDNGARHYNSNLEWLGREGAANRYSVTPEHNVRAGDELAGTPIGGDPTVEVDGVTNQGSGTVDRDGRDDGVVFFPLSFIPNGTGKLRFSIGVANVASLRYSDLADQSLWLNAWIDWDTDGMWEEVNDEHVIDGMQINPRGTGTAWKVLSGQNPPISSNSHYATFEITFDVPASIGNGELWGRVRLDYGENVGRNDALPHFESLPSLRDPTTGTVFGLSGGAARYGEVEDYLIVTDFGDAKDTPFPTKIGDAAEQNQRGARHLDGRHEWLGPAADTPNPTREFGASGQADVDPVPNLINLDVDDGVFIPQNLIVDQPVTIEVTVAGSISSYGGSPFTIALPLDVGVPNDDADSLPRYSPDGTRSLYLSAWADWNNNGNWDDAGEKIIDKILHPETWLPDDSYTLGESFDDMNGNGVYDSGETYTDAFGTNTQVVRKSVTPPEVRPEVNFRFRLTYGENDMTDSAVLVRHSEGLQTRLYDEYRGGALTGEVEDYVRAVTATPVPDPPDTDGDATPDSSDACPTISDPSQADTDSDGIGDACDICLADPLNDVDGDGVCGDVDNCSSAYNPPQADTDGDNVGDTCDTCTDTDNDGFGNPSFAANTCTTDNCPTEFNPDQADEDNDGSGDVCDTTVVPSVPSLQVWGTLIMIMAILAILRFRARSRRAG